MLRSTEVNCLQCTDLLTDGQVEEIEVELF
jgi:hypothetical protein